jgi:hypothetical protein
VTKLIHIAWLILLTAAVGAAGLLGFRVVHAQVAADIYRERLESLVQDYEALRHTYNRAVRRTAVTELLVDKGRLSVVIRTVTGDERRIETPFDPAGEIYVDYAVLDGRLWIRRVFDGCTPPREGILIDPELADVDWDNPGPQVGKAVYRSLGEGRWVVSVTGDGSLGLARAEPGDRIELVPAPEIQDYEQLLDEARSRADRIAVGEVWRRLVTGR